MISITPRYALAAFFLLVLTAVPYASIVHADTDPLCGIFGGVGLPGLGANCLGATSTSHVASSTSAGLEQTFTPHIGFDVTDTGVTATGSVPTGINSTTTINASSTFGTGFSLPFAFCTLTVRKVVSGGSATSSDFMIHVLNGGINIGGSPVPGSWTGHTYDHLTEGAYTVSESDGPAGYTAAFSGDCDSTGTVHLSAIRSNLSCTITNTFATGSVPPPGSSSTSTLTIVKVVSGGSATSSDFMLHVKSGLSDITGSPQAGSATGSVYSGLLFGTYVVSETSGPADYTATFSGACDASGTVNLSSTTALCTVTNTFATSTPGGGTGGGTGGGNGPGTTTPGGGVGGGGGTSSTGAGGGGSPGGGGGNGLIPSGVGGGGGTPGGQVLGAEIGPEDFMGGGGGNPGIPNTGAGGSALVNLLLMLVSGLIAVAGMAYFVGLATNGSSRNFYLK